MPTYHAHHKPVKVINYSVIVSKICLCKICMDYSLEQYVLCIEIKLKPQKAQKNCFLSESQNNFILPICIACGIDWFQNNEYSGHKPVF